MSTAIVKNYVQFEGDLISELIYDSGALENSPAVIELITLLVGDNTIDAPEVDDFIVHGVVIIPPAANVVEPILKGIGADTGIPLSASQASVIQFGADQSNIVFTVDAEIVGLRLVWF